VSATDSKMAVTPRDVREGLTPSSAAIVGAHDPADWARLLRQADRVEEAATVEFLLGGPKPEPPPSARPLTHDDVAQMSETEINERWGEVSTAMSKGR
jgi:hypothetical protein